jgi:hypothetical protein
MGPSKEESAQNAQVPLRDSGKVGAAGDSGWPNLGGQYRPTATGGQIWCGDTATPLEIEMRDLANLCRPTGTEELRRPCKIETALLQLVANDVDGLVPVDHL